MPSGMALSNIEEREYSSKPRLGNRFLNQDSPSWPGLSYCSGKIL